MKNIFIVLDGAAGLPHPFLDDKTPFELAKTPNLDYLTKKGKMGYLYPIDEKTTPGSDNSLISIFGNDPKKCKRGIYEATGLGIKLKKGDLALRCNFGTILDLKTRKVIDRRAGRTLSSKEAQILADAINKKVKMLCKYEFKSAVQHRGVLVLRGKFSDKVSNVDPEWSFSHENKLEFSKPLDKNQLSEYTALLLNNFLTQAHLVLKTHPINQERIKRGLLPANFLFFRGAGNEIIKLKPYKKWMSINPMPLEIGISRLSKMDVFSFPYPDLKGIDSYKNYYNGLNKTIKFALKTLKKHHKNYESCYIQLKETDIPGHDNKPLEKVNMLELIDKKFFSFIKKFAEKNKIKVVVTCDHSTPCILKGHSHHPVPVLVYGENNDSTKSFCEKESKRGKLGKIYGKNFMKKTKLTK
jgi:2,3-bisphosphoglycerate-independent phosphoglycerate mutase